MCTAIGDKERNGPVNFISKATRDRSIKQFKKKLIN